MLAEHLELFETIALNLAYLFIFGFIGLTIHDVMKNNDVPKKGKLRCLFCFIFRMRRFYCQRCYSIYI